MIQRAPRPDSNFTILENAVIRDTRLSYRALGVLVEILSRPDNWTITAVSLAAQRSEGRDAIQTALRELEAIGYLKRCKTKDPQTGQWVHHCMVYDRPQNATESGRPGTGNPVSGVTSQNGESSLVTPRTGKPEPENQSLSTKNLRRRTKDASVLDRTDASKVSNQDQQTRDDVTRLCSHLADRITENGSKRPAISQRWRNAARLMIDRDGHPEDEIHKAIDWCQTDEFWRSNILSLPKLREKYDQMRLQARRQPSVNGRQQVATPIPPRVLRCEYCELRIVPNEQHICGHIGDSALGATKARAALKVHAGVAA